VGKSSKVLGTRGKGAKKRNTGEKWENEKKKWERKIKRESVRKQDNGKKQRHFEHLHWHNYVWVCTCMEFIYESCQSESMKSVTKITRVK
jgi:hypothetical protein